VLGRLAEVAGTQAVIVFFAISGFLLYRPYVSAHARGRSAPRTRLYARRRALRILPGYWTVLTLLAVFPGIVGVFTGDWWRFYGYLQLYSSHTRTQGIAVAWTLCVEVTFYFALPIWAAGIRRLSRALGSRGQMRAFLGAEFWPLALVMIGGWTMQLASVRKRIDFAFGDSLLGQCSWIAIGMALAVASVAVQHRPASFSRLQALANRAAACWLAGLTAAGGLALLVPSAGIFGLIASIEAPQSIGRTVAKFALQAILAFLFIVPAVFGDQEHGLPRRLLRWAPVVWLGVISYSFYLWHLTIVQFLAQGHSPASFSATGLDLFPHLHFLPTTVLFLLSLGITVIIASISYRFIELPFLRRKERQNQARAAEARTAGS
jgi:acetyltransferase